MAGNANNPFGDGSAEQPTVQQPSPNMPQRGRASTPPQRPAAPEPVAQQAPRQQPPAPPRALAPPPDPPQPDAGSPSRPAALVPGQDEMTPIEVADLTRGAGSPLAAAAVPLLGLSARLRAMTGQVNVDAVRKSVYQELQAFAKTGREANVQPEILRAAHYAAAATIDDVVMN